MLFPGLCSACVAVGEIAVRVLLMVRSNSLCNQRIDIDPEASSQTGRARWGEILDAEKMKKCVWVRPKLIAVIEFLEWTEGDRLRHSKFVALRDDKNPRGVVKEA